MIYLIMTVQGNRSYQMFSRRQQRRGASKGFSHRGDQIYQEISFLGWLTSELGPLKK